jgi:hypothetical protein
MPNVKQSQSHDLISGVYCKWSFVQYSEFTVCTAAADRFPTQMALRNNVEVQFAESQNVERC